MFGAFLWVENEGSFQLGREGGREEVETDTG
jgi:hypothetical protein